MLYHFTYENYEQEVLKSDLPVVVDFYADWCGPCRMIAPIVEKMAEKYSGKIKVGKVNVDDCPAIAQQYSIMSIPTMLFMKGGKLVDKTVGALPESAIAAKMEALL